VHQVLIAHALDGSEFSPTPPIIAREADTGPKNFIGLCRQLFHNVGADVIRRTREKTVDNVKEVFDVDRAGVRELFQGFNPSFA
jgi:hypothetical protein